MKDKGFSAEDFCARFPSIDKDFIHAFYEDFCRINLIKGGSFGPDDELCRDLNICEEDADDCVLEMANILDCKIPDYAEPPEPIDNVGQLLKFLFRLKEARNR